MRASVDVCGWVGSRWRDVSILAEERGVVIAVDGVGAFLVTPGGEIAMLALEPGVTAEELAEVVDGGPVRIYALALRGVWALHASAVALDDGGMVAFMGESGHGKSTLAWHLGHESGGTWRHAADDILPVALEGEQVMALPRFPQLKLAPAEQPWLGLPERMPLRAIYEIAGQDERRTAITVEPLTRRAAALTVLRHTVSARLFGRELLAAHLAFAAETATRVSIRRLHYPHDYELLPGVAAVVAADLPGLA